MRSTIRCSSKILFLRVVHVGSLAHFPDGAAAFAANAAFAAKAVFAAFAAKLKGQRQLLHVPRILHSLSLRPGCDIFYLRPVHQKFTASAPGTPTDQFAVLNHPAHGVLAVTKDSGGLRHSTSSPLHPASDICVHVHNITHGQQPCSNISGHTKAPCNIIAWGLQEECRKDYLNGSQSSGLLGS